MKIESIPPALRNLLTKLEYISMIERGQKPCFSDMTFVQSNSWIGAWKRLISGENKKNLLFEIEQIIDRTILAIEEYASKEYVKLLLENLAKAKIGIENLILTYTEHPETISNLRVHIINIDLTLKKHGYNTHPKDQDIENVLFKSLQENTGIKLDIRQSRDHQPTEDIQKIIEGFGKKSQPLPIVNMERQKIKPESFKRFTPKEYIEKHMFAPSSPDQSLPRLETSDSDSKGIASESMDSGQSIHEYKKDIHQLISSIESSI